MNRARVGRHTRFTSLFFRMDVRLCIINEKVIAMYQNVAQLKVSDFFSIFPARSLFTQKKVVWLRSNAIIFFVT